jgi:hypothetical protein
MLCYLEFLPSSKLRVETRCLIGCERIFLDQCDQLFLHVPIEYAGMFYSAKGISKRYHFEPIPRTNGTMPFVKGLVSQ